MTVSLNTLLDRSVRNMGSSINSIVKESAIEVIKRAYKENIYVQISQGYRSNAEQQRLYNQGRTTSGSIVTNAMPGQSLHNYGLAVDYFLVSDNGNKAIWTVNGKWRRVAVIAKSLGFEWGGDWSGFVDYSHLQMTGGLSLSQLREGKQPNLKSKVENPSTGKPTKPSATWNLKEGIYTGEQLQQGDYGPAVKDLQTKLAANHPPFYPEKGVKNNGIDSYYGPKTKDAVSRFQSYYGLVIDGIAGKKTYQTLIGNKISGKQKPENATPGKKQYVILPASAKTWRTYKLNVQPLKKNSDWSLTPSAFGGLTYEILDRPYTDVVSIQTGRGKRNIYVGAGTGAQFK